MGKIFICMVGMILFVLGISLIVKRKKFMKNGEEIIGEVYGFEKHMNKTWSYVYTFTLPDGRKIVGTEHVYNQDKQRRRKLIGDKVTLVYSKENPYKFKRKYQIGIEIGFYVMAVAGLIYLFLGIFVVN